MFRIVLVNVTQETSTVKRTEIVTVTATGNETAIGSAGARTSATGTLEMTIGTTDLVMTAAGRHLMNGTMIRDRKLVAQAHRRGDWILALTIICRRRHVRWMAVRHPLILIVPAHSLRRGHWSPAFTGLMIALWMLVFLVLWVKNVLRNPDLLAWKNAR